MTATPIVALDVPDLERALRIVAQLDEACDFYKVGTELFTSVGPRAVQALGELGKRVFLDLKFHDIPNTVREGAASAARLGASLLSVHAAGGEDMLRAAVEGAGRDCRVLAVTVLTSIDAQTLRATWGRPDTEVGTVVMSLANLTLASGAHGVVCGGDEIEPIRAATGDRLAILVPGVRFDDEYSHDQRRVVTPYDAVRRGARYLVFGRAVTAAADPIAALRRALASMEIAATASLG